MLKYLLSECVYNYKFQSGVFSSKIIGKLCGTNLLSGEVSNGFKFRHMNVELFVEHSARPFIRNAFVCHLQDKS